MYHDVIRPSYCRTKLRRNRSPRVEINIAFRTVKLSYAHWYHHLTYSSQWRHNGHDGVSNHQPHDCLPKRLFRRRSTKTSKLRVTCLCEENSPVAGEFPAQRASSAENVSIWWRHHDHLTYWSLNDMAAIFQSASSDALSWQKKWISIDISLKFTPDG